MIRIAEAVQTANSPVDPIALDVVKTATRNFSRRNVVGEGTYGIVYEVRFISNRSKKFTAYYGHK
jgi:ABC-type taurine transport system ATPase subunit